MNEETANIIDFLNRYELDLGSDASDAEVMTEGDLLKDRIARLLVQPPVCVTSEYADLLRNSLSNADWNAIAKEQQRRIMAADTLQAESEGQGSHPAGAPVAE